MSNFFETRSYWHGGFTEDQQEYYKEYRLSQKGIHLWRLIHQSYEYAKNLCSIYNISFCRNESCCFMRHKHLAFQCEYNEDETLASYAKGNYDFYDVEQIEEFVAFKGAYEITSFLENIDDAPYKSESLAILNYCLENHDANYYITDHLERISPPREETNDLQDSMEEEIAETKSSLDEKEEESDEQEEEEWSHPCLPSNESNSSNLTLYEYYDPIDSFEISLFDEVDAFYAYGRDATMNDAYGDELSIVPHVKHEIVSIAPTLDCPIILLESPNHIPENCALIEAQCDGLHLSYVPKDRVENYTRVFVGHEQYDLCDSYILDVVHDTTENYFERGKFGYRNFHVTKTPLSKLKLSNLFLFHLPMHVTLCFFDLFSYEMPMHRKWVRLKCVSYLLLDALFCFKSLFL